MSEVFVRGCKGKIIFSVPVSTLLSVDEPACIIEGNINYLSTNVNAVDDIGNKVLRAG